MNSEINYKWLLVFLLLFQCSEEEKLTAREQAMVWMTDGVWEVAKVENSETGDRTSDYRDFVIAFVKNPNGTYDGDYYLTAGGNLFPELFGQWKLSSPTTLILASGREMEVSVSASELTMHFFLSDPGGRRSGLEGSFTFTLRKQ